MLLQLSLRYVVYSIPQQLSATTVTQLYHLQAATLQTDERTDNAGSEWEVEWFDEAIEAAELVRHLPVPGNRSSWQNCLYQI